MGYSLRTFVVVAGGTGGHIFPAKSLADELRKNGHRVIFLTDQRGKFYTRYFAEYKIIDIPFKPGFFNKALFYLSIIRYTFNCLLFLRRVKPEAVIGFGSYVSVPGVLAAQLLRIKTVLHEQNTVLGKANRLLAYGAKTIAGSYELPNIKQNFVLTGNPVREDLLFISSYKKPEKDFKILVMGGSQGARIFSEIMPIALKRLPANFQERLHIYQQCREELCKETRQKYEGFLGTIEIEPFFEDMEEYYAKSHLVIARSGATTVAELCAVGRPSILVPFSSNPQNEQWNNANYMQNNYASIIVSEYHFTSLHLSKLLNGFLKDPTELVRMAENAKKISTPNAQTKLAKVVYEAIGA